MSSLWPAAGFALLVGVASPIATAENPLDADRAMGYLEQVCEIGPRMSGSDGMRQQIALLTEHFESLGGELEEQNFPARHPLNGTRVEMTNLIVRYRPDVRRRILICCHYDTRPLPDRDPNPEARRNGTFIGANDGGSGVAVLMELAHLMPQLTGGIGVDLVMFDGEELVYRDSSMFGRRGDPYFLGSKYFARAYKARKKKYAYQWGVLLDMVGDADLRLRYDRSSWNWRDTRPLVKQIWATAEKLGVDEFQPRLMSRIVQDDHLPLHNEGGIRCIDIIDFDYPYWHTEQDVPANCSGESLAKVGWVVWEWLRGLDAKYAPKSGGSR
ncbi:MAG: M28 family peptidase [Planctomycetota bacterium]